MGMPIIVPSNTTRCQAITDIIESVALEQTALSHILNAEGEKIQKIVAMATTENSVSQMLAVNKSVKSMVDTIARLEMILQGKLELFSNCLCADCNSSCTLFLDTILKFGEDYGPINTITKIDKNNYSVLTVDWPVDVIVTTTPNMPITVISLDSTLDFSGNTLTIIEITTPDPKYAILQIGEGACTEQLSIEVVTGN